MSALRGGLVAYRFFHHEAVEVILVVTVFSRANREGVFIC